MQACNKANGIQGNNSNIVSQSIKPMDSLVVWPDSERVCLSLDLQLRTANFCQRMKERNGLDQISSYQLLRNPNSRRDYSEDERDSAQGGIALAYSADTRENRRNTPLAIAPC